MSAARNWSYSDTDLVVIMSARPEPFSNVAGAYGYVVRCASRLRERLHALLLAAYALCLQRDQFGRCTVGQINFVPKVSKLASFRRVPKFLP